MKPTPEEALAIATVYCENRFPYPNDVDGSHLRYDAKCMADQIMRGMYEYLVAIYELGKRHSE